MTDTMENLMNSIDANNKELQNKYLTFWLDRQSFGVPIYQVVQIVSMQEITPMPEMPYYVKGVINLRGNIIPVIDGRLRLNKPETEYNDATCIIITIMRGKYVGLIVDEVDEVKNIGKENISDPPRVEGSGESSVIGIARGENKLTLIMDLDKVLGAGELAQITTGL